MTDLQQRATRLLMAATLAGSGLLLGTGAIASELTPEKKLQAASLAATCANCHGTEGRALQGMEALAGKDKDEMLQKLLDFKNGRKPATIMHQLSKGYTDEQLAQISAYFAAQKKQ